jgi:hypothetical protein
VGHFHARVRIPLSSGSVELTVDVPDLDQMTHQDTALIFGVLNKAIDFARAVTLAEVEEPLGRAPELPPAPWPGLDGRDDAPEEPEDEEQEQPAFSRSDLEVPCPDCERSFTKQGLGVHRARAHPRKAPSAPEPKPELIEAKPGPVPTPRVCAEPGCDTLLSAYNKRKWCSLHEGNHLSPHFGRTG